MEGYIDFADKAAFVRTLKNLGGKHMKGSVLKKFLCTCLVTAAAFAATTISASACTTIYVGGDLVEEGTPFVARTEDYGSDYNKLWFISESGKWKQGDHYVGCPEYGPFEWDFTHDSYRFTYFTNDIYYDGTCPECGEKADHYSYTEFGTNEKGVSVSAPETLYGNEKVAEVDPYRDAEWAAANGNARIGIEETDIPTIILAEASSAREGVKLLLDIYENYGCVYASGVFICDKDEVWYIENCSGTQYVAIKLNDNMIFLEPNMAVIGRVDLECHRLQGPDCGGEEGRHVRRRRGEEHHRLPRVLCPHQREDGPAHDRRPQLPERGLPVRQ